MVLNNQFLFSTKPLVSSLRALIWLEVQLEVQLYVQLYLVP